MPDEDHKQDRIVVEPFPLSVLPEKLLEFVTEAANAIKCPPDYIAVPMLAVLGTAIGTRRQIKIKDGWLEPSILWTAVVGDTGSAKSPALQMAAEPLVRLQSEFLEDYSIEWKTAKNRTTANATTPRSTKPQSKSEIKGNETAGCEAVATPNIEPIQGPRQSFTTDATLEAVNACLWKNPAGVAYLGDELTAFVLGMNEYKKGSGADRPHWQSMWNGSQIVVNRKNYNGPLMIPKPFVSVIGGLPPSMLGELCDERGREDGFIHRFLFTFPDSVPRELTDEGLHPETLDRYCRLFSKLRYQGMIMCVEDPATVVLDMSLEAFREFKHWANEHYVEMESGHVNLRGSWAKLVTYCARLSLIIYLARTAGQRTVVPVVDLESVRRAIALITYFKSHTRKVYSRLFASAEERKSSAAVEWLKKRPGRCATQRDFETYKVGGVRTSEDASALLVMLERNGWGRIDCIAPPRGGPISVRFTLDCRSNAAQLQIPHRWRN